MSHPMKIIAKTQLYENYAYYEGGEPKWKPKGGFNFVVNISNSDELLGVFDIKETLSRLVAEHDNDLERFELVDFEYQSSEPMEISESDFLSVASDVESEIQSVLSKTQKY